jgi:hypothetical protein
LTQTNSFIQSITNQLALDPIAHSKYANEPTGRPSEESGRKCFALVTRRHTFFFFISGVGGVGGGWEAALFAHFCPSVRAGNNSIKEKKKAPREKAEATPTCPSVIRDGSGRSAPSISTDLKRINQ